MIHGDEIANALHRPDDPALLVLAELLGRLVHFLQAFRDEGGVPGALVCLRGDELFVPHGLEVLHLKIEEVGIVGDAVEAAEASRGQQDQRGERQSGMARRVLEEGDHDGARRHEPPAALNVAVRDQDQRRKQGEHRDQANHEPRSGDEAQLRQPLETHKQDGEEGARGGHASCPYAHSGRKECGPGRV